MSPLAYLVYPKIRKRQTVHAAAALVVPQIVNRRSSSLPHIPLRKDATDGGTCYGQDVSLALKNSRLEYRGIEGACGPGEEEDVAEAPRVSSCVVMCSGTSGCVAHLAESPSSF